MIWFSVIFFGFVVIFIVYDHLVIFYYLHQCSYKIGYSENFIHMKNSQETVRSDDSHV